MHWFGISKTLPEPPDKRERVYEQIRRQERRIQAIDRVLAVIQRDIDNGASRVDA